MAGSPNLGRVEAVAATGRAEPQSPGRRITGWIVLAVAFVGCVLVLRTVFLFKGIPDPAAAITALLLVALIPAITVPLGYLLKVQGSPYPDPRSGGASLRAKAGDDG